MRFRDLFGGHPGGFSGVAPDHTGLAIAGLILTFVFLVLVVAAGIWIVRGVLQHWARHQNYASPGLGELDSLYARGEITREQYLARKADILAPPGRA